MRDENFLPVDGCFILNLDQTDGPGTHWTAVFPSFGFYYDPFGLPWPKELNKLNLHTYNSVQHQKVTSNLCGLYCIYVIRHLYKNPGSFYEIMYVYLNPSHINKNDIKLRNLLLKMQKTDC